MKKIIKSADQLILDEFPPGLDLYDKIKGAFVSQGSSLHEWIDESGSSANSVRMAIHGMMNGPKGKELRVLVIKASGLLKNKQVAA